MASALQQDQPAVEEEDGAEQRVDPLHAGEADRLVAEPRLNLLAEVEDEDRQDEGEPEAVP